MYEQIQPYDAQRDAAALTELWRTSVGHTWPLSGARIQRVLTTGPSPQHFVVREDGRLVGFAATFKGLRDQKLTGHLAALLVAPDRQGRGIGTALHDVALDHLRAAGVRSIQLGSILPRFWCGVPGNLPGAVAFFQKRGWTYANVVYDMVQDVRDYHIDPRITQRMQREQITIEPATRDNVADALAFEGREFPNWLHFHFEPYANLGDYQDILVARNAHNHVVGTLCMVTPRSHPARVDLIWQDVLGEDAGGLGAVGVAEAERGCGIGIALVARGTEILRARGVRNVWIDWLVIPDFYARAGYKIWREYHTSWRDE